MSEPNGLFLSIIVSVYNKERYLHDALDSFLDQDLAPEAYEILCVNDGSTDGSLQILDDYAARYENVRVISKENGGLSAARNTGLRAARGAYVSFF